MASSWGGRITCTTGSPGLGDPRGMRWTRWGGGSGMSRQTHLYPQDTWHTLAWLIPGAEFPTERDVALCRKSGTGLLFLGRYPLHPWCLLNLRNCLCNAWGKRGASVSPLRVCACRVASGTQGPGGACGVGRGQRMGTTLFWGLQGDFCRGFSRLLLGSWFNTGRWLHVEWGWRWT